MDKWGTMLIVEYDNLGRCCVSYTKNGRIKAVFLNSTEGEAYGHIARFMNRREAARRVAEINENISRNRD